MLGLLEVLVGHVLPEAECLERADLLFVGMICSGHEAKAARLLHEVVVRHVISVSGEEGEARQVEEEAGQICEAVAVHAERFQGGVEAQEVVGPSGDHVPAEIDRSQPSEVAHGQTVQ